MNTAIQTLPARNLIKIVIVSFLLITTNSFGADFRAKQLNGNQGTTFRNWNNPATWERFNTTTGNWEDATTIPTHADKVRIDDGSRVETTDPILECLELTVYAPDRTVNPTSLLDINNTNLRVYGNILVTNGANQGNVRIAEIIVDANGILEASGSITPNAATVPINDNNKITVIPGGIVSPYMSITPLPVELTSFSAIKKNAEVALTWETASERNCKGFELQTSADGKNYIALDFINSQNGNSSAAQRYAYTHKTSNREGLIYYRLKQVDLDGKTTFYHAKVVDLGRFMNAATIYPNPFHNQFRLELKASEAGNAEIVVKDLTGRIIVHNQPVLVRGSNTIDITLKDAPAGVYLIHATAGGHTYTNRIVKQ